MPHKYIFTLWFGLACLLSACTAKVVGDPDRPITINAHITLDIRQLENTAGNIEDYVSGKKEQL